MSGNPFPSFHIKESDELEAIEMRISLLIRLYLTQPKLQTAHAIIHHLNVILARPNYIKDVETRCQYRQLAEHWRLIAWLNESDTSEHKSTQPLLKMELKQLTL